MASFVSAILMSVIALPSLITSGRETDSMKIVYSCIVINGIGSAGFHYLLEWGWNLLDQFTMIIAICSGLYIVWENLFRRISTYCNCCRRKNSCVYDFFSSLVSFLSTSALSLVLVISAVPDYEDLFATTFGILVFCILPPIFMEIGFLFYKSNCCCCSSNSPREITVSKRILLHLILSLVLGVIGAACWMISERLCYDDKKKPPYGFIFFHAIWHVLMSYALVTLSQCVMFIRLSLKGTDIHLDCIKSEFSPSKSQACCVAWRLFEKFFFQVFSNC